MRFCALMTQGALLGKSLERANGVKEVSQQTEDCNAECCQYGRERKRTENQHFSAKSTPTDFYVDLPDLTCPDLFPISVERVTNVKEIRCEGSKAK